MEGQQPPKHIFRNIKKWIENSGQPINNSYFIEIYQKSSVKKRIRNAPYKYPPTLEGANIGVIPKGRVWGYNGAIITPDNKLLWDVSLEYVKHIDDHSIFKLNTLPPISYCNETVADLTHVASSNYYHWMYEVLPKIHLIQRSGIKVDQYIVKYEPKILPIQNETLTTLGIGNHNLIKTSPQFHLQADILIVPSQPYIFPTKWAYDFLRKVFLKANSEADIKKRIYISRKGRRKITNEEELMKALERFGFIKVELEKMSVDEQVQLFSSAEMIISPHGAGLANLTFCGPETKIIEIFSPTYINCIYWLVSNFGQLDYHYFIGDKGKPDDELKSRDWTGNDNIWVNIPQFTSYLKSILN